MYGLDASCCRLQEWAALVRLGFSWRVVVVGKVASQLGMALLTLHATPPPFDEGGRRWLDRGRAVRRALRRRRKARQCRRDAPHRLVGGYRSRSQGGYMYKK